MTNQETATAEKFVFEQIEQKPKEPPEVTIYKNGLVRFSKSAVEKYGLRDAQIVWGENESHDTLAMQKKIGGRVMRGENNDQTSCPLTIAQRYVGKYTISRCRHRRKVPARCARRYQETNGAVNPKTKK